MAQIKGIETYTDQALMQEVQRGGRFVVYEYCFSILIMTFKRGTDVYFVRADESRFMKGLGFTMISLLFGWWGFPWGFIYTPMVLVTNLSGGRDVTNEIMAQFGRRY